MRQRERELRALQASLTQAEATNAALAEELVSLTRKNDEAMVNSRSSKAIEQELDSLQARHAAALEILGEKDEQLQAAQEDLLDIKAMYKELLHERFGE
jgi:DNA repair exonuclease SbcCD ATPase subunit